MVANTRPPQATPVIRALAVQMAAQRPDLDSDARFYLAGFVAHVVSCYGRPGVDTVIDGRRLPTAVGKNSPK